MKQIKRTQVYQNDICYDLIIHTNFKILSRIIDLKTTELKTIRYYGIYELSIENNIYSTLSYQSDHYGKIYYINDFTINEDFEYTSIGIDYVINNRLFKYIKYLTFDNSIISNYLKMNTNDISIYYAYMIIKKIMTDKYYFLVKKNLLNDKSKIYNNLNIHNLNIYNIKKFNSLFYYKIYNYIIYISQ